MKKYNQLIITLLGFALISGCSSEKSKDTSPPPGYTKLFQGSDSITYLKKMDSWHYQGNSDIIQFEMIISFFKEDTVVGKKFQSIKEKILYDCNTENKYTKIPIGFFSDKYATGKAIVPYPLSSSRWLIAENNSLDAIGWQNYCVKYKKAIDAQS
ncbi:TPA: hypothetical protein SMG11_000728 [Serratia marcescens]|nr:MULTISPECIES: surface-adhesin E family protein [Serratia]AWC72870.1 hypothetical protein AM368_22905 [Serratia marcescens]AWC90847.1 hypothetical protein AM370_18635 [Serratia marcescens]AWS56948.1 hypothetical protein AM369_01000 [Serratia marcescens]AWS68322.1 hypothetical protein AM378_07875 [Serratia marcescens]EGS5641008.1 hypothetical protein [Serratia marcescens]